MFCKYVNCGEILEKVGGPSLPYVLVLTDVNLSAQLTQW